MQRALESSGLSLTVRVSGLLDEVTVIRHGVPGTIQGISDKASCDTGRDILSEGVDQALFQQFPLCLGSFDRNRRVLLVLVFGILGSLGVGNQLECKFAPHFVVHGSVGQGSLKFR